MLVEIWKINMAGGVLLFFSIYFKLGSWLSLGSLSSNHSNYLLKFKHVYTKWSKSLVFLIYSNEIKLNKY